jgi:multidrug efflux pump
MDPREFFIRRPVFTTVLSLVIILFGLIGFSRLGVREFPRADRPVVSVNTSYPGANAAVMESQVTEVLEEEINTVSGIRSLRSTSRDGRSSLRVEFELGDDLDRAANDIRDRVAAARQRLPEEAEAPVVEKADAEGDPIVFLNIKSEDRSLLELTEIADNVFKPRFETIDGVGRVDIWGDKEYAMRVWLDPDRLSAYGLTPREVRESIRDANLELPTGRLEGQQTDVNLRILSRLGPEPDVLAGTIIAGSGDQVVRLGDVARVEIAPRNERTILKRDGVPMVGVVLRPQSGANEIAIVDEFYERLDRIRPDLPPDIELGIGFDTSEYIRDSLAEVRQTLFLALILVCLTIFLFLREGRTSLIPLVTIPVSLIGGLFFVYLAGYTINVLTLLALVLAVGLVVDDAVVVLENIYTKIEAGLPAREAAAAGLKEIFFPVIATTLSLVAVFTPIVFIEGLTGKLFSEFGVTLAAVVIVSSVVALTLTPMLGSRILRGGARHKWFYRATEPFFAGLNRFYRWTLRGFLRVRILALPLVVVLGGGAVWLYNALPRELAPTEDRGLLVLSMGGPPGANFNYMSAVMDRADEIILENIPEREALISVTSPGFGSSTTVNSGFARLVLTDRADRDRSQEEIVRDLEESFADIAAARISVRQPATLSTGGRGLPVRYVLQNADFSKIREVLPLFLAEAQQRPEFTFVDADLEFNQPEIEMTIDRNRAESLGVPIEEIAETTQAALAGQRYGSFLKEGNQYDIVGQMDRPFRDEPADLRRVYLRADNGERVSLEQFVSFREVTAPPVLYRFNRFPAATVSASLAPGVSLADGLAAMDEIAAGLLDETFSTDLRGQSREFRETGQSLVFVFVFALLVVFLVLAAQFESFRDPLIIMLTVPLALLGGLLGLRLFGQSLNLFSQIGLIMLIGLVTKNGILLVEFINQRRRAGLPMREAVLEGSAARFRPILMTSLSTILGILPIAIGLGAGSESRMPLGIAVIGGLLLSTLLTLYIVPAAYTYLASRRVEPATAANAGTSPS